MSTKGIQRDQSHWQQLVEQQVSSGLSGAAFCRLNDIGYANFMSWRKKLQTPEVLSDVCAQSAFVELTAPVQGSQAALGQQESQRDSTLCVELSLGAGIELRITRQE